MCFKVLLLSRLNWWVIMWLFHTLPWIFLMYFMMFPLLHIFIDFVTLFKNYKKMLISTLFWKIYIASLPKISTIKPFVDLQFSILGVWHKLLSYFHRNEVKVCIYLTCFLYMCVIAKRHNYITYLTVILFKSILKNTGEENSVFILCLSPQLI